MTRRRTLTERRAADREGKLVARWQRWIPWATIEARKYARERSHVTAAGALINPFNVRLHELREQHRAAINQCRALRIPWTTIVKWNLDDPRLAEPVRDQQILLALERRRDRLGRTAGVGHPHNLTRERNRRVRNLERSTTNVPFGV